MAGPPSSLLVDDPNDSLVQSPPTSSALHFVIAYNVLQFVGFAVLVPVVLTAWVSPRVHRASTWFPFMFSWIFSTIVYSLLMVHQMGPPPSFALCLTQAGLIYAAPTLSAMAGVAFVLQIYFGISSAIKLKVDYVAKSRILLVLPFCIATMMFLYVLMIGVHDPDNVQRSSTGMYCHLEDGRGSIASSIIVATGMSIMIIFEAFIAYLLYRNWAAYRRIRAMDATFSLSILVRATIFSFLPLFVLIINFFAYAHRNDPIQRRKINVMIATLPLLAGLVFGTQRDILRTWFSFGQPTPITPTMVSIHIEKSVV